MTQVRYGFDQPRIICPDRHHTSHMLGRLLALATVGCATLPHPMPVGAQSGITRPAIPRGPQLGSKHQFLFQGGSYRWQWVAGCQTRSDTDGDGETNSYVNRQGEIIGDTPSVYLWTADGREEPIDEFIAQSPSGRFVAYLKEGRLLVFDGQTHERIDLSALGAVVTRVDDPMLPPFGAAFSYGHWVVFLRRTAGRSQVVGLDLSTQRELVLWETPWHVKRLRFDAEGRELVVTATTVESKAEQLSGAPPADAPARAHCHALFPAEQAYEYQGALWPEPRISIADMPDAEERVEILERNLFNCIADGRRVVVKSTLGGLLVAAPTGLPNGNLEVGPVQWVRAMDDSRLEHCLQFHTLSNAERRIWPVEMILGPSLNAALGIWQFDTAALNRDFVAHGFSTTGTSHSVLGGEGALDLGRIRTAFKLLFVDSEDITRAKPTHSEARISAVVVGVFLGYRTLTYKHVSLIPEIGVSFTHTNIGISPQAPPLDTGFEYPAVSKTTLQGRTYLFSTGLRLELRPVILHSQRQGSTYLTFGASVGWQQQLASSSWRAQYEPQPRDVKDLGSFHGPDLDMSGPQMLLHVGVAFDGLRHRR